MGRTKSTAVAESHEVTPEQTPGVEIAAAAANQMAALRHEYGQGRDLVNQMLGQVQMANAAGGLLQTFGVAKLAFVKENKLYQQLAGMKTPNGLELCGTWCEFCELLGMSDEKANQDIANLKAFGEEALENMNRIGIGYRDLRQYRKLPADERLALIEAAKDGDKEGLLDLAETLIARHTKEKEALTHRAEDAEADLEASRARVTAKETETERLTKELGRAKKRIQSATPDEEGAQLREEVNLFAFEAEATILGKLTPGFEALAAHAIANNCTHEEFMSGCLAQIERALTGLRNRFNVKAVPDGNEIPDWLRPGAEEKAAEQVQKDIAKAGKKTKA